MVVEVPSKRGFLGIGRRNAAKTPRSSLTAAGSPIAEPRRRAGPAQRASDTGGPTAASRLRPGTPESLLARSQRWQHRALAYTESVPEVAGACALVRSSMERIEWKVEGGNQADRDAAQARVDGMDFARAAELIWSTGETYIGVPTDPRDGTVPDAPYSLSIGEFDPTVKGDGGVTQVKGPNGEMVDMLDGYMRVWRRSKSNRWQAFSPMRAALDLVEAMYLAQLADTAVYRSRLAGAGIVYWPTNAPSVPVEPGQPAEPGSREAMLEEFEDAAWASITEQNSREATIPFVVFYDPSGTDGATAYKPEMFRIERDGAAEDYAVGTEARANRFAATVELPAGAIAGGSDGSKYEIHQIDIDKWKTWFSPLAELIRKEFELRVVKQYNPALTLKADPIELITKPDQTDTIMKLATLGIVTPQSVKKALISQDLADLEPQEPPQTSYSSNTAPGQPSDFSPGDSNRGGGKFQEAR